jgi:hypothetical protein
VNDHARSSLIQVDIPTAQSRPASGSRDGFYPECFDCGYDESNCACDENTADDHWLEDEEARERLREEDVYLYGI